MGPCRGEKGKHMRRSLIEALNTGPLEWQNYANCLGADADLFFPERGSSTRKAKAICAECEVKIECLEFALEKGERFGIWGGLSERERRRVRHDRARRTAVAS